MTESKTCLVIIAYAAQGHLWIGNDFGELMIVSPRQMQSLQGSFKGLELSLVNSNVVRFAQCQEFSLVGEVSPLGPVVTQHEVQLRDYVAKLYGFDGIGESQLTIVKSYFVDEITIRVGYSPISGVWYVRLRKGI